MLSFSATQMVELECRRQAAPDEFKEWILRHLLREMPDLLRGIPLPLLLDQIDVAVARARSHGLTTDSQLLEFVSVMHEVAPNFDDEPTLRRVLQPGDGDTTPEQRWEALFAGGPSLEVAWERAAHPLFYDARAWLAPADR
jgi:hypothetical protein